VVGGTSFEEDFENAFGFFGDVLVGDVYQANGDNVDLAASVHGDGNILYAFNDELRGGDHIVTINFTEGDSVEGPASALFGGEGFNGDTIVGDVWAVQNDDTNDVNLFAGAEGSFNDICVYNDLIVAGESAIVFSVDGEVLGAEGGLAGNVLVGDVYAQQNADDYNYVGLSVSNGASSSSEANNNTFHAFNDTITSGGGDDTLVGDVWFEGNASDTNSVSLSLGNSANNFSQANNNSFSAFNDELTAGGGDNVLVGDVWFEGCADDDNSVGLSVRNSASSSSEANGNSFNAFNDELTAGDGDDTLVGDVRFEGDAGDTNTVSLSVGNSAYNFSQANDNTFSAFNDTLAGGEGHNVLVGDVWFDGDADDSNSVTLSVWNYASSSSQANGNSFNAFNDVLIAGTGAETLGVAGPLFDGEGDNVLVGDVWFEGDAADDNDVDLSVWNSANNFSQANGNSFNAFNDTLTAGEGDNVLVGDVRFDGDAGNDDDDSNDISLSVWNSASTSSEANDNSFNAFNDELTAGDGKNVMVGDVYADYMFVELDDEESASASNEISLSVWNYASNLSEANDNSFNAFNDTLTAGAGECSILVGDVYAEEQEAEASGSSTNYLYNSVELGVFNDASESSTANNNTFNAFNDVIAAPDVSGGTLVGDVYANQDASISEVDDYNYNSNEISLEVSNRAYNSASADENSFNAFNDTLTGGTGSTLVGDVLTDYMYASTDRTGDETSTDNENLNQIFAGISNAANYGGSANNNSFNAFNDSLTGAGDNTIVGDVYARSMEIVSYGGDDVSNESYNYIGLDVYNSADGSGTQANGNTFTAFNDTLVSGSGEGNVLVGDIYAESMQIGTHDDEYNYNSNNIDLAITNSAEHGETVAQANGNSFDAFNDVLTAEGSSNDTMVGDVWASMEISTTGDELDEPQYNTNAITLELHNYGFGQANNNDFTAFNDTMNAGDGNNVMAGDVMATMSIDDGGARASNSNSVNLTIFNSNGGDDEADNNSFNAFNDSMTSGDGNDEMAGDVALFGNGNDNTDSVNFSVLNFAGDNNTFTAFNDTMTGGGGDDAMTGDVYMEGAENSNVTVSIADNGGGTGNVFSLFNDTLDGGDGDDTLVGDVWLGGSSWDVDVQAGGYGGSITAFSDSLAGGGGNDALYGDALDEDGEECEIDVGAGSITVALDASYSSLVSLSGIAAPNENPSLFADTLVGGGGNDTLDGGIGYDSIDGGAGNDIGLWDGSSQYNLGTTVDGGHADLYEGGTGDDILVLHFDSDDDYQTALDNDLLALQAFLATSDTSFFAGDGIATSQSFDLDGDGINDITVWNTWEQTEICAPEPGETPPADSGPGSLFDCPDITTTATLGDSTSGADQTVDGGTANVNQLIEGGGGNDILIGGNGDDEINGRGGNDTIRGDNSPNGGSGTDCIHAGEGDDLVFGGNQGDAIFGEGGNDTLNGEENNDSLDGGSGNDTLDGNNNDDLLFGSTGNDSLTGGNNADVFAFDLHHNNSSIGDAFNDGDDRIADFDGAADILQFFNVLDSGDGGGITLIDLNAAISSVVDSNGTAAGGDVTVSFDNDASIVFEGVGTTTAIDSIDDLVTNANTQIIVSG
jgi:Ca2+-binding RTX toxin-like protein